MPSHSSTYIKKSFGIYIHIPVCETLCGYCDFYSVKKIHCDDNFWKTYYNKLLEEFYIKLPEIDNSFILNSIYFGGGTPSLAPASFIENIINFILKNTPRISRRVEISLEANPETISHNFVSDISHAGINRLSLGVQSLNDYLLAKLDRLSTKKNTLLALDHIAEGAAKGLINNWNADIIFGIPGQREQDILETSKTIMDFGANHISAYALTVEKNTLPDKSYISQKRQIHHQKLLWDFLPSAGYNHYEVSNFAKKGFYCLHNLAVWKYRPYLSLGPAGHSFLNKKRYRTVSDINRYLSEPLKNLIVEEQAMTIPDLFITSLRLKTQQGNSLYRRHLTANEYNHWKNILKIFNQNKWLKYNAAGFTITSEGLNFSNSMVEIAYEIKTLH